ncbi:MAG TPA: hypothetical protein VM925_36110 [Labilithrix sp.]|nr:hypothetical protein [Labilithrix sp.]
MLAVWNGWRERPLSPSWLRILCIASLGLALTVGVWAIVFAKYPAAGGGDGIFFFRLIETGKVSISRWHELPLWNPYECGGVPLWDNPQSIVASPLVLLLQPLSTTATIGIWAMVHATAGFVGMWLLCRSELESSRFAAFVAACLFAFSAPLSNHVGGGHTAFAAFQFAPLALYLWRRAETDRRMAIGLGLLVANTRYEGGVYPLPFIALLLAIETATRLTSPARALAIVRAGAVVAVIAGLVGAARLLPVVDQLTHHKRPLAPEVDFIDWPLLKDMYLARSHALRFGHEYVWGEYVAYTGPIVLVLAAAGIVLGLRDKKWLLLLGTLLLLLMLGHFASWAPWSFLKNHVPPFVSMRVPSRFRLLLALCIAGWVALAIDRLPRTLDPFATLLGGGPFVRAARVAVTAVAIFAAGDVASHSMDIINSQWDGPTPAKQVPEARLHLGGPNLAQFIDQPRQNRGRLECWEEWAPFAGAPLWAGDLPQAKVTTPGATVYSVARTQSSFLVDIESPEATTVLFNTSWARGWRTDVGQTREQAHELVVDVPAGHHRMRVWYWPVGLTLGLVLTALGLALAVVGLVRKRTWY